MWCDVMWCHYVMFWYLERVLMSAGERHGVGGRWEEGGERREVLTVWEEPSDWVTSHAPLDSKLMVAVRANDNIVRQNINPAKSPHLPSVQLSSQLQQNRQLKQIFGISFMLTMNGQFSIGFFFWYFVSDQIAQSSVFLSLWFSVELILLS